MVRRFFLVIGCAVFLLFTGIAYATLEIPQTKYNFGEVEEKTIIEHTFQIINPSSVPVDIISVTPDCGCTVADFTKRIEPKQTGHVKLKLDTRGYKGFITKTSIVKTSDDVNKEFVLVLEGNVKVPIDISSRNILFYGPDSKGQKKQIIIKAQKPEPLSIQFLRNSLEGKVSYNLQEKEKGKVFELVLECLEGPEANFYGELVFKTNYPQEPEIKIMVRKMPLKK
jgi:hypothetical protein